MKPFSLILILLLSSCAITNIHMKDHPYQAKSKKNTNAGKIHIQVDNKSSNKVGVKKGGYGNETAEIYLEESQSDWLKNVLSLEFQAYGYEVISEKTEGVPSIQLTINQLFVEPDLNFFNAKIVGVCDVSVSLKKSKDQRYRRNFVEIDESSEMVWTDVDYVARFHGAVNNALTDIVIRTHVLLADKE